MMYLKSGEPGLFMRKQIDFTEKMGKLRLKYLAGD